MNEVPIPRREEGVLVPDGVVMTTNPISGDPIQFQKLRYESQEIIENYDLQHPSMGEAFSIARKQASESLPPATVFKIFQVGKSIFWTTEDVPEGGEILSEEQT